MTNHCEASRDPNPMGIGLPFEGSTGRTISGQGLRAALARRYARWHYFSTIERAVPRGALILEFGSGGGDAWLAQAYNVVGLELAMASARASKQTYGSAINADAGAIPLRDGSVDAAVSSFVLEHFDEELARAVFAELRRVLKPGGIFISLCDLESDHPMLSHARSVSPEGYREAFIEVPGHHGLRREGAWRALLAEAGFDIRSWQLRSRFPVLDHCPWCQLDASCHFPRGLRRLGRAAYRISQIRHVGPLWGLVSTVADDLLGPLLPRSWAYRLLFVAHIPTHT